MLERRGGNGRHLEAPIALASSKTPSKQSKPPARRPPPSSTAWGKQTMPPANAAQAGSSRGTNDNSYTPYRPPPTATELADLHQAQKRMAEEDAEVTANGPPLQGSSPSGSLEGSDKEDDEEDSESGHHSTHESSSSSS